MQRSASTIAGIAVVLATVLLAACAGTGNRTYPLTEKRGPLCPAVTAAGVIFRIAAPDATLVTIAGSFNGWNDQATELARGADGTWSVTLQLKPGRHLYKFLVDGFWVPDPSNPDVVDDGFGGLNSSVRVP